MFWTTRGRVFFMGGVIVMITSRGCILGLPYFILGASLWKSSTLSGGKLFQRDHSSSVLSSYFFVCKNYLCANSLVSISYLVTRGFGLYVRG
jgi:hypothetical protein